MTLFFLIFQREEMKDTWLLIYAVEKHEYVTHSDLNGLSSLDQEMDTEMVPSLFWARYPSPLTLQCSNS